MADRIILLRELKKIVPVHEVTIWRLEKAGKFPKRLKVGNRAGWLESEVEGWIAEQAAKRQEA